MRLLNWHVPRTIVLVALALVAGSAVTAGAAHLITGKNVKNGSLTGADIRNQSLGLNDLNGNVMLTLRHGDPGPPGPQGPKGDPVPGPAGPAGPRGDTVTVEGDSIVGPRGPAGPQGTFGSIHYPGGGGGNIPPGETRYVYASCPQGQWLLAGAASGGGGYIVSEEISPPSVGSDGGEYAALIYNPTTSVIGYSTRAVCATK